MSTFLARMSYDLKNAPSNMLPERWTPGGLGGHGILGFATDKAERWGGAFAFGAAKGYYREKFVWRDHGLDVWIGGALTILATALNIFSHGTSRVAPHIGAVGDAGISSYLNSRGTAWGTKKAGRTVQVLEGGKALPALGNRTGVFGETVGAIPPVAAGADYLTDAEMMHYGAPR